MSNITKGVETLRTALDALALSVAGLQPSTVCSLACGPHGSCVVDIDASQQCICDAFYAGEVCDQLVCPQCLNGAACTLASSALPTCQCSDAYTGVFCETPLACASNPCVAGTCQEVSQAAGPNSFACLCTSTTSGVLCQHPCAAGFVKTATQETVAASCVPCPKGTFQMDNTCAPCEMGIRMNPVCESADSFSFLQDITPMRQA